MNFRLIFDNSLFLTIQFNPPKTSKYKQNWSFSPSLHLPLHQDYVSLSLAWTSTAAFLTASLLHSTLPNVPLSAVLLSKSSTRIPRRLKSLVNKSVRKLLDTYGFNAISNQSENRLYEWKNPMGIISREEAGWRHMPPAVIHSLPVILTLGAFENASVYSEHSSVEHLPHH